MAAPSEEAIQELVNRLGLVGPQAEAVARSLVAMSNASDRTTSAKYAETEAIRSAIAAQNNAQTALKQTAADLKSFTTSIISTADSVAGSGGVFTSVTPAITFFADNIQNITKILPSALGAIGTGLGSLLAGPAGAGIGTMIGKGIGKVIDGTIGTLAPVMATIANQYLQQGEKVIQAFNGLSTVGITFGGSLENMHKMISSTNMPLEMLAKVAQQNAENLALLGGGTAGALERVAKAARNDLGPQLVTLYGGFANLGDELADYLAMEQRRGVSENLLSQENIEGTKNYLYQLKEVSALTGKSSKQLKADIEARARNAAMQGMYAKMDANQRANFDKLIQTIPEGARDAMQDLILAQSRGLEPVSEQFLQLEAMTPGVTSAMRRIAGDLRKGPDEFNASLGKATADMATESGKMTEMMGDILYLKQAGRVSASVINTLDTTLTSLNENRTRLLGVADDIKLFAEQTRELKNNTEGFVTSVHSIYDAQSNMARSLNELIVGNKDTPSKFNEFARLSVVATNFMNSIVTNLDKLVSKLIADSGETRVLDQNERITQEKTKLANLDQIRADLLRPFVESTNESIPYNMPIPEGVDRQTRRRVENIDQSIKLQEQRLADLEIGLANAKNQSDESKKRDKDEADQKAVEKAQENAPTMLRGQPISDASSKDMNYLQFANLINKQNDALSNLALALNSQGNEIKRAVDRMA